MSKALVIPNANFLVNSFDTVEIGEVIPCTSLTLSQNSIAFSNVGGTVTLTATITPADCTQAVTWSSSNDHVATVENGVVTCVGVGSATITATCGTRTATCTVTASVVLLVDGSDYYHSTRSELNIPSGRDYGSYANALPARSYFVLSTITGGKRALAKEEAVWANRYPIIIPANASTVKISAPSEFDMRATVLLFSIKEQSTYNGGQFDCARAYDTLTQTESIVNGSSRVYTVDISGRNDHVDALAFSVRMVNDPGTSGDPGTSVPTTLTFT